MPRKKKNESWAKQVIERYSPYDPKTTLVLAVGNLVELARVIDDLQTRMNKLEHLVGTPPQIIQFPESFDEQQLTAFRRAWEQIKGAK